MRTSRRSGMSRSSRGRVISARGRGVLASQAAADNRTGEAYGVEAILARPGLVLDVPLDGDDADGSAGGDALSA